MENQRGPALEQETLLNVTCQPGWEGSLGQNDPRICVAESLRWSPGTATTWLIGYTPPKDKKVLRRCFRGWFPCVIGSDVAVPTRPSSRSADTDWGYVVKVQEIKKKNTLRCYRQPQVNGSSERENAQGIRDGAVTLSLTRDPATQLNTLHGLPRAFCSYD